MAVVEETRLKETRRVSELNLEEDNRLVNALRMGEEVFNADVPPPDAELRAPSDFYAAIASGPPRTRSNAPG
ncbi:hypothetical protein [Bradyrhizobium sp. Leo121]|uniref:hypothetical protein n=1 Tax=Bradyrhizobium sp. Leo121 TaxID=1571195 RepID=UPI00102A0E85|nr:hypothetical protein [Bradyrhizobium sp. Leo121]